MRLGRSRREEQDRSRGGRARRQRAGRCRLLVVKRHRAVQAPMVRAAWGRLRVPKLRGGTIASGNGGSRRAHANHRKISNKQGNTILRAPGGTRRRRDHPNGPGVILRRAGPRGRQWGLPQRGLAAPREPLRSVSVMPGDDRWRCAASRRISGRVSRTPARLSSASNQGGARSRARTCSHGGHFAVWGSIGGPPGSLAGSVLRLTGWSGACCRILSMFSITFNSRMADDSMSCTIGMSPIRIAFVRLIDGTGEHMLRTGLGPWSEPEHVHMSPTCHKQGRGHPVSVHRARLQQPQDDDGTHTHTHTHTAQTHKPHTHLKGGGRPPGHP